MGYPALAFTPSERRIFAKREAVSCSAWAARNLIVQDGIYRGSPLRLDVSPYLSGPLDAYSRAGVEEVILCGSLQIGKTLFLYACLGFAMDYRPGTKMLAMPTRPTMERVVDEKLLPLLKGSPALRKLISKARRESISLSDGTAIILAAAESPSQRASITVQDLFLDEEDLYVSGGHSNALEDFKGRTRSYGPWRKVVRACQPKGGEESSIWRGITREADQLYCYEVACPACRQFHLPDLANLVVPGGEEDPKEIRRGKLARYRCPHCKWAWSDHIRDLAVAAGQWRPYRYSPQHGFEPAPAVDAPISVGYHLPAILSRSVSLSELAARRIIAEASDDPEVKRQFCNDDLALPYIPVELKTTSEKLLELREPWLPARTVPHGAVALTCGIDVQKRGFWYLVRAWMPTLASYVIDYGQLAAWEEVYGLLFNTWYPVQASGDEAAAASGEMMEIWRAGIDSGGTETDGVYTRTEEVYNWVRAYGMGRAFACKGASHAQVLPVRRTVRERMPHNGRPIHGGLNLYLLDTGVFKTLDFSRMLNPHSEQPLRFHSEAEPTLTEHLSAEEMVRKNGKLVWQAVRQENHLLDCLMLSAACADASWTPSLPHYVLQLQQAAREEYQSRPTSHKKSKPRQEQPRRWGA